MERRKLQWYGHITRHGSLAKTILQGPVEGGRKRGNQENLGYPTSKNGLKWTYIPSSTLPKIANCGEVCASQLVPLRHKPRPGKMMIMMRWNSIQDMYLVYVYIQLFSILPILGKSWPWHAVKVIIGLRLVRLYLGTKYEVCILNGMIICPVV